MNPLLLPLLLWSSNAEAQDAPTLGPALPPAPVLPVAVAPETLPIDAVFGPQPPSDVLDALPQTTLSVGEDTTPSLDSWLDNTEENPETPSPFSWWLAPLGLIGVGVLVWSRKRMGNPLVALDENPMTVLSKQVLTPQASLVLLEVQTQDGESRRLLVGVGENGPVLVSDLGGSIPGFIVPDLETSATVEVTIEDPEEQTESRRPIQDRVPRAPRPMASAPRATAQPERTADVHTLAAVPRRVANKGLVGRFTQADLAPQGEPERTPVVQAWSKAPAPPRHAPPPRLRHEAEKQEFLSTRDLVAPISANARRL